MTSKDSRPADPVGDRLQSVAEPTTQDVPPEALLHQPAARVRHRIGTVVVAERLDHGVGHVGRLVGDPSVLAVDHTEAGQPDARPDEATPENAGFFRT
jgi:hypothetical protein